MEATIRYEFSAVLWRYKGKAGWFFVSLPKTVSKEIRDNLKWQEEAWGRMKVKAILNNTEWETAIWFDTKNDTYLLPVKAAIRNQAGVQENDLLNISIHL